MKNTKIVATIGPASESKETLRAMIEAGMNVARLNFSHGEPDWNKRIINRVRELSHELAVPIALLADLQGPRIRTEVAQAVAVKPGDRLRVSDVFERGRLADLPADKGEATVYLDMAGIIKRIESGQSILIEDGTIELKVVEKHDNFVIAEAVFEGTIQNRKGVTLPDTALDLSILTEKDRRDLRFALEQGVDYIGLSFVGSADDIEDARAEMRAALGEGIPLPLIVAKIERKEAIKNLSAIVRAADAVMVARGDLGIETPESEVAILQKEIVAESLKNMKPVIVATQMMESMVEHPRPTRAEVSDVSNAVIDHCDAVMLSEESAMGKYPVETIRMMSEIIGKTEESRFDDLYQALDLNLHNDYATVLRSVYELAVSFEAQAILLISMSGFTARLLSHFRPERRVLVATNNRTTYDQLALVWGIDPYLFDDGGKPDTFIDRLVEAAKRDGKLQPGDQTVVFSGRTPDAGTLQLVGIREIR